MSLARHPGSLPDAFLLPFEVDIGKSPDFASFGLACPPSIQRSVPKRQAEYLAGRRVALAALGASGACADDLAIGASRAPVWPSGYTGSITHADGLAAAIALPDGGVRGVGIDIEHRVSDSAREAVLQSIVDAKERQALAGLIGRLGEAMAFTIAFSAKESFYKATASTVGRIFEFDALKIVDVSLADSVVEARVAEPLAASVPGGMRCRLGFHLLAEATVLTSYAFRATT